MQMRERDLFDIFPDLPGPPRGTTRERVREIRARAARKQLEMKLNAARQHARARKIREEWEKRRG